MDSRRSPIRTNHVGAKPMIEIEPAIETEPSATAQTTPCQTCKQNQGTTEGVNA